MRRMILAACLFLAAGAEAAETAWRPVGLCGGGALFSLAGSGVDADAMMVHCDMSAAYMSRDAGRTWRMVHHAQLRGCTSCSPVFHPRKAGRIYSGSGWTGRVHVSDDGGATWRELPTRPPWRGRPTLLYLHAPPGKPERLFAASGKALAVTDDGGKSWTPCKGFTGRPLGMGGEHGRDAIYLGTTESVFVSTDGGKRFVRTTRQILPEGKILSFAMGSNGEATCLYLTAECGVEGGELTGGVYVSTNRGVKWTRCMTGLNTQTKRSSQWAHGDVPRYGFIRTTDVEPRRAYVHDAGTSYFPPNHATVYRTDDAGGRWRAVFFSDPRFKQYNVADDWLSRGVGQRWQSVPSSFVVNPGHPDVVMMCTGMFLYRTDDGGKTWRVCHTGPPAGGAGKKTAWTNNGLVVTTTWNYDVDPHQPNRHYICYTDIGFARSRDAGKTWTWAGHSLPWRNTTYELAFDPAVEGRIWAAMSNVHDIPNWNVISGRHRADYPGGLARSDDFGVTWEKVPGLPPKPCLSIVLDANSRPNARRLYASIWDKGVYRSDDGGATWRLRSEGLGHPTNMRCCKLHLHADGTLFVLVTAKRLPGGELTDKGVGLYRSDDRGETWREVTESLPIRWPKDFTVRPGDGRTILLSAATSRGRPEGGLYRTTDGGATWRRLVQKGPEHFGAFYHPRHRDWMYMTLTEGVPMDSAGLWLSRDDGATWQPFAALPFSNIQRVHFPPGADGEIVVTTFGGSVWRGPETPASKE